MMVRSGAKLTVAAWIVAQANQFAREHALQQFVVYQGNWSLAKRDMERDIIPMCRAFGMAIAPWGVMGGGKFKDPEEIKARKEAGTLRADPTEDDLKVSQALKEVAQEVGGGVHLASIALAWCRQMYPDCYPVIGGAKISQLQSNIEALRIHLTPDQMEKLSNAAPFDWGFPYDYFGRDPHGLPGGTADSALFNAAGSVKF
ncbi:oxidoreductase with NAD+ or NADP+ as acceptor [Saitozyma sp. JCM 24511]|nr:oxidoreductase with NAD+ or NADP+ as acceptor [Saitozyma sp. JCM 24511]